MKDLKAIAEREGASAALAVIGSEATVEIPLSKEFLASPIDELNLSVRSRNGLMRARIDTVGKLADGIMSECGLGAIRNLGKKSIQEIKSCLLDESYRQLPESRKEGFWMKVKELNNI